MGLWPAVMSIPPATPTNTKQANKQTQMTEGRGCSSLKMDNSRTVNPRTRPSNESFVSTLLPVPRNLRGTPGLLSGCWIVGRVQRSRLGDTSERGGIAHRCISIIKARQAPNEPPCARPAFLRSDPAAYVLFQWKQAGERTDPICHTQAFTTLSECPGLRINRLVSPQTTAPVQQQTCGKELHPSAVVVEEVHWSSSSATAEAQYCCTTSIPRPLMTFSNKQRWPTNMSDQAKSSVAMHHNVSIQSNPSRLKAGVYRDGKGC